MSKAQGKASQPDRQPTAPIKPEDLTYARMPRVSEAPAVPTADVATRINGFIEEALETKSPVLKAEDCYRTGMENLKEMVKPLPDRALVLESGTEEKRTNLSIPFGNSTVSAATLPGMKGPNKTYPQSKDGVLMTTSPDGQELSLFISHSNGYSPEDAALSNAAATTSAYEMIEHPGAHLPEVFGTIDQQLTSVSQELGTEVFPEMIAGRLRRELSGLYELEIASTANQMCFVFHDTSTSYEAFRGEKIELTDQNVEAVAKNFGKNFSYDRILEKIESEEQDPARRAQMIKTLREQFEGGPRPELLTSMAKKFLRSPATANLMVAPGEIVLFTSPELVDFYGGADSFLTTVRGLLKSGPYTVDQVVKILIDDAEKSQENGDLVDTSVSLIAFRAPEHLTE